MMSAAGAAGLVAADGAPSEAVAEMLTTSQVVVTPGETITAESGYLIGHGTYVHDGELVASTAGVVERVNKLVSVRPLSARYTGEVGDVVVGRIIDVGPKRWRVDIGARQDAVLLLSSVNLSGGVQRRRNLQDQLNMRDYFSEHDLISADVHSTYKDGAILLHARSLNYGKLENGQFTTVPPALVKRCKQHFVTLPCGIDMILGNNGYIWMTESLPKEELAAFEEDTRAGTAELIEAKRRRHAERFIGKEGRLRLARAQNAVNALRANFLGISPDSIMDVYTESERLGLTPKEMLNPAQMVEIVKLARERQMVAGDLL